MIILVLTIICVAFLISIIKQTNLLKNEYACLEIKIKSLSKTIESSRKHLQKKLNRNLILQKRSAGEPIPVITFQKLGITVPVLLPSDTVYTLAEDEGCGLSGTCEGNGDCGLCAMDIVSGSENFDSISDIEKEILNKLNYPEGARLSCQAKIRGDATVNFMNVEGQV